MRNNGILLICPSIGIWKIEGDYYFDRKFYDGILAYCSRWQGEVRLAMREMKSQPPKFGLVRYVKNEFSAALTLLAPDELVSSCHMQDVSIVYASGDSFMNLHIAHLCRKKGTSCVFCIENILRTRLQIVFLSSDKLFKKIKRSVWLLFTEIRRRRAFRLSGGLISNGVAAYDEYRQLSSNTLLYFDTRITSDVLITEKELNSRLAYLDRNLPLRLGFSGRLIGIKGADHLIEVANELNIRKVPFTLDIFGSGDLVPVMKEKIQLYGLGDFVKLRGVLDFSKELIPVVKKDIDLYVVCHRQSDPSCTYLETYACGVPIAGYDNRAHKGILNICDVGWSSSLGDVRGLAETIQNLHENRNEIKKKSLNAMRFAREHTFEKTVERRIAHIEEVLNGTSG